MSVGGASEHTMEETSSWWQTENDLVFDTVGWQVVDGIKVGYLWVFIPSTFEIAFGERKFRRFRNSSKSLV